MQEEQSGRTIHSATTRTRREDAVLMDDASIRPPIGQRLCTVMRIYFSANQTWPDSRNAVPVAHGHDWKAN
jgi:hypothetical protein